MMDYHYDEHGQAVVEFALIVPILLFLLMGMFLLGYWLNAQQVVTSAAREGAREAALTGNCSGVRKAVMQSMQVIDNNDDHTDIKITPFLLPARGQPVSVAVTYRIQIRFLYFEREYEGITKDPTYPFRAVVGQATARMETDPKAPECPRR